MNETSQNDQLLSRAQSALDNGDIAGARERYAQICNSDPNHIEAWLMYGILSGELGHTEVAQNALERAVSLDTSNAAGHLALAHVLRTQGQLDQALASAYRAVGAEPDLADGWLAVSAITGMLRDWLRAEEACNKAVELAPERAEAHVNLGNVFLGTGRAEQAETAFRKALAIGESAEAWFGMGSALGALGRDRDAEPALDTACHLKPGDQDMAAAYAACLARLGTLN
jgi:tetratricopeptide (TPR) repeat protein